MLYVYLSIFAWISDGLKISLFSFFLHLSFPFTNVMSGSCKKLVFERHSCTLCGSRKYS